MASMKRYWYLQNCDWYINSPKWITMKIKLHNYTILAV